MVAIIGVLGALATAVASKIREGSKRTQALNQIRNLGIATQQHVADNDMRLPGSQHSGNSWLAGLQPYLGIDPVTNDPTILKRVYRSPGDTNKSRLYSYAINDFLLENPDGADHLNFSRTTRLPNPSQTFLFSETQSSYTGSDHFHFALSGYSAGRFSNQVAMNRYRDGTVYVFADGHAKWIDWSTVQNHLTRSGDRFVHPEGNP